MSTHLPLRGTRHDDASGKIDRQVEQMQSRSRLDDAKIAAERLNELTFYRKYFEIKYYASLVFVYYKFLM